MIAVDHSELTKLASDSVKLPEEMRAAAKKLNRAVSFAVEKRIKIEMPVDTGRARASWGHWTSADLRGAEAMEGDEADAIFEELDGGLTIVQGSNVDYIEWLNQGHSRQAPAGFIDRAAMFGQLTLEEKLGLIDPLSPEYTSRLFLATFG